MTTPHKTLTTWWPQGNAKHPHSGLGDLLRSSAQRHARAALAKFTGQQDDQVDAAVHAGTALEHLTRAYLVSVDPVLLVAEKADLDTMLHLTGRGHLAGGDSTGIRSVSFTHALIRARSLLPTTFQYAPSHDDVVQNARNSAIHMAVVTAADLQAAIRVLVRLTEPLLSAIGIESTEFWGADNVELVKTLLDESTTKIKAIVDAKITAARQRFESRLAGLDDAGRVAVLNAISGKQGWSGDHDEMAACPACGQEGWLVCSTSESDDVQYDVDDDGMTGWAYVEVTAVPDMFQCSACGLDLEDLEVQAAGFPSEIELEPRDVTQDLYDEDRYEDF